MESLLYLDLNNNHLLILPESIGNLRQLKYLDISQNWWDTLPYEITKLRELKTLIIDEYFAYGLQEMRYFYAWFKKIGHALKISQYVEKEKDRGEGI